MINNRAPHYKDSPLDIIPVDLAVKTVVEAYARQIVHHDHNGK